MERLQNRRPAKAARSLIAVLCVAALAGMLVLITLEAADITPGYTFTTGEKNITHSKLNSATAGSINTTFYTDKTAATTPAAEDLLLLYSVADTAFRKITLDNLVFANSLLISNRTEETSIASNDFVLVFDVSGATHVKARVDNLISNSLARPGPIGGATSNTGTFSTLNSTIFIGATLTNSGNAVVGGTLRVTNGLAALSTVSVAGAATLSGDVSLGDNAVDLLVLEGTLAGTLQGEPTVSFTSVTLDSANDKLLIQDASDANKLKIASMSSLGVTTFTTNFATSTGLKDVAHGLGGVPTSVQWRLACTNANAGYSVGDEIDISSLHDSSVYLIPWVSGANATNVFCSVERVTGYSIWNKTNQAGATFTASDWEIRVRTLR